MTFPKKLPAEIKLLTFDFTNEAAVASTLSTPVITATSSTGGNQTDLTINSAVVSGKKVTVLVGAGLKGMTYRVTCEVDASNGEHHGISKDLPVADDAALVA